MTTYVCGPDTPDWRFLWGDTTEEIDLMLQMIGPAPLRPENISYRIHVVTKEQVELAVACGATLTDKWGPAFWAAQRRGDTHMIAVITQTRAFTTD